MSKNGDNLDRLGAVTKLLTPGENIPPPTIIADTPAANINGLRTSSMKIGVGLSFLGTIIGAMGGNLGVEAQYQQAKSAVFEFQSVFEDKIDVVELDQYLGDSDINPASVFVRQLLDADKLYIITATIKSNKFTFDAKKSDGTDLKVDMPVIQQIVGGNVKIGGESAVSSKLTYEGKIPLIIGFQAVQPSMKAATPRSSRLRALCAPGRLRPRPIRVKRSSVRDGECFRSAARSVDCCGLPA